MKSKVSDNKEQSGGGLRYNQGKTRHDLVPAFAQEQYARVLTIGANKYEERNWESGMNWTTVMASLKRHIVAWEQGEDIDPDTGQYHTAHIMCNAAFLTEYYRIYPQGDDRPHTYLKIPKIGLDIDEVIADWVGTWARRWNMEVPDSWYFDRTIQDKFTWMRINGELEQFYDELEPLIKPEDIPFEPCCYITSRPCSLETTIAWLDKHGFPGSPVYQVGMDESKVAAAKRAGVEIMVDDRYENFVDFNRNGICCFLIDRKHNRRYNVGHKRIYHLRDVFL